MEKWKDVKGYEGLYQVSDLGRIKSFKTSRPKALTVQPDSRGYLQIGLVKDGKRKNFKVHRLVAKAFINNEFNKPQVNHINEDKTDNRAVNLEWVTQSENSNHGSAQLRRKFKMVGKKRENCSEITKKIIETKKKNGTLNNKKTPVICLDMNIKFNSIKEAGEYFSIRTSEISACCKGKRKTCGGHRWAYITENN